MKQVLVTYIPVLHQGYLDLFERSDIRTLYIIGEDLSLEVSKVKEIRKVDSQKIMGMVTSLKPSFNVEILTKKNITKLKSLNIVITKDFVTTSVFKKYLPKIKLNTETAFLRWDEKRVTAPSTPNHDLTSQSPFDIKMMKAAREVGSSSSDWWRRVGCVVVKNKKIIVRSFNEHFPTENTQYAEGDPRDFVKAGTLGFLASSAHAEQMAISKAAKSGISLKGCDIYVSTYPCPTCAKLMATAGIKKCFFMGSNAYLDVEIVLKSSGVKSILVEGLD